MTRLITDPLYGDTSVSAPERLSRPNALGDGSTSGVCPFCPGNESMTPPEIARRSDVDGAWTQRVFQNLYPIFVPPDGVHEVIVESPHHSDHPFASPSPALDVLTVAMDRLRHHRREGQAQVMWLKNQGAKGGASIEHAHSHVMAMATVPPRVTQAVASFARSCVLCQHDERYEIARAGDVVLAIDPASRFPYGCRIAPVTHSPRLEDGTASTLTEVSALLARITEALQSVLPASGFNLALMTAPSGCDAFHWHIDVMPRVGTLGGLELAAGVFVNVVDPLEAVERLRGATPDHEQRRT